MTFQNHTHKHLYGAIVNVIKENDFTNDAFLNGRQERARGMSNYFAIGDADKGLHCCNMLTMYFT